MKTVQIQTKDFPAVSYRMIGDEANARVVMLVHGFPDDGNAWVPVAEQLGKDFLVLVPDLPGSGDSVLDKEEVSLEALGRSIAAILESRNIARAVLAGHSMGGYTLLALAAERPELFCGLSLVHSSAHADTEEKKETRRKSIDLIRKGGKEPFVKQMVPGLFSEWTKMHRPAVVESEIARGMRLKEQSMISFYNAMIKRPDRTEVLANAAFPVQWIVGMQDNAVPHHVSLAQASLSDVSFVSVYNNCGHMSMAENTETLIADLKEFITYCYNQ
jgi:pimeloyl-ACP methyl ester carboxylesterase